MPPGPGESKRMEEEDARARWAIDQDRQDRERLAIKNSAFKRAVDALVALPPNKRSAALAEADKTAWPG